MTNSYSQQQQNCQGETTNSENPLQGGNRPLGGEDFSRELQGEPGESQLQNQQMTLNPVQTSGRSKVTSSVVITSDPRVQLFVLKEETFPIPLKYIGVTRSTHTDLDVL